MKIRLAIGLAAVAVLPAGAEESAVGVSDAVCVDARVERRALSPKDIGYSPEWGATDAGAYVVLEKVEHPDTSSAVTSELARFPVGQSGDWTFTLAAGGERCIRLLHKTFVGDQQVGETLSCDLAFGEISEASEELAVNCDPTALQTAVSNRIPVTLCYDPAWGPNGVTVSIEAERIQEWKGEVYPTVTNVILAATTASGDCTYLTESLAWGAYTLRCFIRDANGDEVCEPLTAGFGIPFKPGFLLLLR